jgi:dihydropteroate synthase
MRIDRGVWQTARGAIALDRPLIVGVLNVTPDSFWPASAHLDPAVAIARAAALLEDGADILDIGGESTRPGAHPVSADEEIARVEPVVSAVAREWPDVPISVDTVKASVAAAGLAAGAWIINDVSGLRLDPEMVCVASSAKAGLILMHSRGGITEMARYESALYGADPVGEIVAELRACLDGALSAGVAAESVVLDPGLGFSKKTAESIACIAELHRLTALGRPVLIGPSRKRFVGELSGVPGQPLPPENRLEGTIAACVAARLRGASLFRVHDVKQVRRALAVADAIVAAA